MTDIIKNKIFKRLLAIVVVVFLVLNPLLFPVAVYAQETTEGGQESTQPTPTPTPTTETSTTNSEVTPTPTPQSTITTGDASSSSEVDTTANTNQDTISGEITTPPGDCNPPEGETSCPPGTEITNNNVADVGDSATSSASTGENSISGTSGDASITTGEATASGSIENEVNTNIVELEPDQEGEAGAEVSEDPALTVDNQNQATVSAQEDVSASTGENQASGNAGNAEIKTGNALAYGNIFNLINTNIVGTNFVILVLNLVDQAGDIDLNKIWKEILTQEENQIFSPLPENSSDLTILVANQNQADLETNLDVEAFSGGNQASGNGGVAIIKTGNATALANVVNLVNTNLLGSVFFLGIINIFDSFTGNLILPRPERFVTNLPPPEEGQVGATSLENGGGSSFINQNEAELEGEVSTQASSGENELLGNASGSSLTTGNAKSAAQSFSVANLNVQRNNWFFMAINNLGSWLGYVLGWSAPGAVETTDTESNVYNIGLEEGVGEQNGQTGSEIGDGASESIIPLTFINENKAKVKNKISATAQTGQNEASGNQYASVETGRATALANLFNLVNLNILGGRWFLGLANILGDWQGNAVFAYPDVQITVDDGQDKVAPGDFLEYTVSFQNQGYDEAQGVVVQLELPAGTSYISDTLGVTPQVLGNTYTFGVGNIPAGMGGSFKVRVEVDENYSGPSEVSFWSKIIPKALAAEEEFKGNLVVNVSIVTQDPESNTGNNSFSDTNQVFAPVSTSSSSDFIDNPGEPKLEITAWNNVGEFVYPGDTVTFELIVKNTGTGPAYESVLTQKMFDDDPQSLGDVQLNLGKIESGKRVKITFGLALTKDLPPALYHTVAKVTGKTPKGQEVTSNSAETQFEVWPKGAIFPQVLAAETQWAGEAKAQGEPVAPSCTLAKPEKDWLPYILVALLATLWLTDWLRRKGQNGELAAVFSTIKKKLRR